MSDEAYEADERCLVQQGLPDDAPELDCRDAFRFQADWEGKPLGTC